MDGIFYGGGRHGLLPGFGGPTTPSPPIGTATYQGNNQNSTGNTLTFTTVANMVAGELAVVKGFQNQSRVFTAASDPFGNVWVPAPASYTIGGFALHAIYSIITTPIPAGSTVTLTYSGTGIKVAVASSVLGINPSAPYQGASAGGTGVDAIPISNTGVLTQAKSIVFGLTGDQVGNTDTMTPDAGFTLAVQVGRASLGKLQTSCKTVSSTAAVARTEGLNTARTWQTLDYIFNGIP